MTFTATLIATILLLRGNNLLLRHRNIYPTEVSICNLVTSINHEQGMFLELVVARSRGPFGAIRHYVPVFNTRPSAGNIPALLKVN